MKKYLNKLAIMLTLAVAFVGASVFFGPSLMADMTTGTGDRIYQRNRLTTAVPAETATRKTQQLQVAVAPIGNSTAETMTDDDQVLVTGTSFLVGTSDVPVWDGGIAYTYPNTATAAKVEVVSDSTSDSQTSTGALSATVWGLNSSFARAQETILLYGQDPIWTTATWLRIFGVKVDTVGSGGTNAGAVYAGTGTVTTGVPGTIYAKARAGTNRSHSALYTVPADKYAIITGWGVDACKADEVSAKLIVRKPSALIPRQESSILSYQASVQREGGSVPIAIADAGSDIEVKASADQLGTTLTAFFKAVIRNK